LSGVGRVGEVQSCRDVGSCRLGVREREEMGGGVTVCELEDRGFSKFEGRVGLLFRPSRVCRVFFEGVVF